MKVVFTVTIKLKLGTMENVIEVQEKCTDCLFVCSLMAH